MPFIDVRSSGEISRELEIELKTRLGRAIGLLPGKSEDSLMIQFSDHCRLWFGGETGNVAFVNVMLYGAAPKADYRQFSDTVIPMLEELLGVRHVYLKFEEVANWFWLL